MYQCQYQRGPRSAQTTFFKIILNVVHFMLRPGTLRPDVPRFDFRDTRHPKLVVSCGKQTNKQWFCDQVYPPIDD